MYRSDERAASSADKIYLLDYLIILARHSRMIIYTTLAVALLTYLVLFLLPNKYTAAARILSPQQNLTMVAQVLEGLGGSTINPGGGLGPMASGLLGLKSPGEMYVGMMSGDTISDRIIERFKLREHYGLTHREDVRQKLHQRVQIEAGRDGLITINVTDTNPQRAQEMANAYVDELDGLLQQMGGQEAKRRLTYLEKKREETLHNLVQDENNLRNFSERTSILQVDAQTRNTLEYIATLRATIDAKDVQVKVLQEQATPFNYDVIKLETEVKGLKEKLHAAEGQEVQNPRTSGAMIASSKIPALGLEYLRLYREVKFQEKLYKLYSKLVEMAHLDEAQGALILHVVDRARVPEKRSNQRLVPAALAGIGTFLFMVFLAFVLEYWQDARRREETANRLKLIDEYLSPWFRFFSRGRK
jgi:tyrosine-protein kinase Etk/Wzc